MQAGGTGGRIQLIDWDGTVLWDYRYLDDDHHQHHDIELMPNGNVLLIAWERKSQAEAIAAGRQSIGGEMWPTEIVEIEPDGATGGNIVWEWHLWDHLIQDVDSTKSNYGKVSEHPELMDINYGYPHGTGGDWIHVNYIDYNETLDQIAFSSYYTSEIYVIDHSTNAEEAAGHIGGNSGTGGDFLYRWGNPQVYGRGDPSDQHLYAVHSVKWIAPGLPGEGNILLFNNGNRPDSSNDYSSVEEIIPPVDGYGYYTATDSAFGPTEPCWVYSDSGTFYSSFISGASRLPNGNTLICEGARGYLFEVTASGTNVWDYYCGGLTMEALRYGLDYFDVEESPTLIPKRSVLEQNSPNPFSHFTAINYQLSAKSKVLLNIYHVTGRVARTIVDKQEEAGRHSVCFDARNLPVGIYFAELSVSGETIDQRRQTMKLVIVR
jgi:hypothetical protein